MDLVLAICLSLSPDTCRDERILFSATKVEPFACMLGAVPTLAEWIESHPEWVIRGWTCLETGR